MLGLLLFFYIERIIQMTIRLAITCHPEAFLRLGAAAVLHCGENWRRCESMAGRVRLAIIVSAATRADNQRQVHVIQNNRVHRSGLN